MAQQNQKKIFSCLTVSITVVFCCSCFFFVFVQPCIFLVENVFFFIDQQLFHSILNPNKKRRQRNIPGIGEMFLSGSASLH